MLEWWVSLSESVDDNADEKMLAIMDLKLKHFVIFYVAEKRNFLHLNDLVNMKCIKKIQYE